MGTTLGQILLPTFLSWLFQEFGFINGFLLYGGIAAHGCISNILLKRAVNAVEVEKVTSQNELSVFKTSSYWFYVGGQCFFCMGQMTNTYVIPNVMELTGSSQRDLFSFYVVLRLNLHTLVTVI